MRFMVIVKANKDSEAGAMPSEKMLADMGRFNEEMAKAGVMLSGDGLHPSSRGTRIKFSGGDRSLREGPFGDPNLVAGFWLIQTKSKQEAIDWISRAPFSEGEEVEIRQVFETEDFGPALTPEVRATLERTRAQSSRN